MVKCARVLAVVASGVGLIGAVACEPSLDDRTFQVSSARVLAVQSVPAEALPGGAVALRRSMSMGMAPSPGPFDWAFCEDRNPLADLNSVSPTCATLHAGTFLELGHAPTTDGQLPTDACRQFGPDVPSALPGQLPGRPVDPDATGGYYQPVRLAAGNTIAVGLVRVTCEVAGATSDQTSDLAAHDHPNANPAIDAVSDSVLGALVDETAGANAVQRSQRLDLRATWAACDPTATSCTGSEVCLPGPADARGHVGARADARLVVRHGGDVRRRSDRARRHRPHPLYERCVDRAGHGRSRAYVGRASRRSRGRIVALVRPRREVTDRWRAFSSLRSIAGRRPCAASWSRAVTAFGSKLRPTPRVRRAPIVRRWSS